MVSYMHVVGDQGPNSERGKVLAGAGSGASISSKDTRDQMQIVPRVLRPANVTLEIAKENMRDK
jgi:hypothetical protein